ncbi:hypothetical protein [Sphingobium sp. Z007]|uniref:hypothetical protein n=1 Tax=Sphingobium sp. Z007 TaxID=627495 RepID=UPI001124E250|nr:hypothetical protein [Sphingobium sp. Z007]
MQLGDTETGLLEDCFEDWRGLWEVVWADPDKNLQSAVALVTSLVAGGYLTTLGVTDWDQARTAEPMAAAAALAVVQMQANYLPPQQAGAIFYLLSITPKGEAAIPPGAFPDELG